MDWGGWMWAVIDIAMVAILAGAMIYGGAMWRHRPKDAAVVRASDDATRRLYHPGNSSRDLYR